MEVLQILIDQMVTDISNEASRLDEVRLRMFLKWLQAHAGKGKEVQRVQFKIALHDQGSVDEHFKQDLKRWFNSLPIPELLWEYHLILNEISWWRRLDQRLLCMILVAISRKKND